MAIGFQTSGVGQKTATTGTTFTISLTSTTGDLIIVGVALGVSGTLVSGVADTVNTYDQVGTIVNGSGLRVSVWKTRAVTPTGGSPLTITVTLSASGCLADGAAASYRGVAFAGSANTTLTGSASGTMRPASTTLAETNAWLICVGGTAANNAFTITGGTGALRVQGTGTTLLRVCIMDSNDLATPVRPTVTMTAANWALNSWQLRLIEVTQIGDQINTWVGDDVWALGYGQSISGEQINNWVGDDVLALGRGISVADQINTWVTGDLLATQLASILQLTKTASDQMNMTDGPVTNTSSGVLSLGIICPHLGLNWLDSTNMGMTYGILMSDQINTWVGDDVWALEYGLNLKDIQGVSMQDSIAYIPVELFRTLSDAISGQGNDQFMRANGALGSQWTNVTGSNVINNNQAQGSGASNNVSQWSAAAPVPVTQFSQVVVTNVNQDTLFACGPSIRIVSNTIFYSVQISGGGGAIFGRNGNPVSGSSFGPVNNGDLIRVEAYNTGSGTPNVVLTVYQNGAIVVGPLLDSSANRITTGGVGIYSFGADATTAMDNWAGGSLYGLADKLSTLGYGMVMTEDASPNWNDLLNTNLLTPGGTPINEVLSDQIVFNDQMGLGYGNVLTDQMTQVEALRVGYGLSITDTDTANWADLFGFTLPGSILSLILYDEILGGADNFLQPDNTPPDGAKWGGDSVSDVGHIVGDTWGPNGIGESMIRWIANVFGPNQFAQAKLVDTTADWFFVGTRIASNAETCYLGGKKLNGGGASPFYQIIQVLSGTYTPLATSSTVPVVNDVVRLENVGTNLTLYVNGSVMLTATDAAITDGAPGLHEHALGANDPHCWTNAWVGPMVQDALGLGYGNRVTDQIIQSEAMGLGYGNIFTDTMTQSEKLGLGYGLAVSDDQDGGHEGIGVDALGVGYGNLVKDQLVMTDGTPQNQGDYQLTIICPHLNNWADNLLDLMSIAEAFSDQIVFTDSLGLGYGDLIADQMTMADFFAVTGVSPGLTLTLNDQDTTWADFMGAGYGAATSDQIIVVDSLSMGYGGLLSDAMTLTDSEQNLMGMLITFTDQLVFTDSESNLLSMAELFSDQLVMSDFLGVGYGVSVKDQTVMTDQMLLGYGLSITDQDVSFADFFASTLATNVLTLTLSDQDTTWADFMGAGYGAASSDQIIIVDSLSMGYGGLFSDQLVLTDSETAFMTAAASFSDQLVMSDSESNLMAGFKVFSDQIVMTDSESNMMAMLSSFSDQLVMTDSESNLLSVATTLSDQMTITDFLMVGYGLATLTDQVVFGDSFLIGVSFGEQLSDQLTLTDSEKNVLGMLETFTDQMVLSDSESAMLSMAGIFSDQLVMSDFMGAGYGASTSDQVIIVDSLMMGYGALLSDQDTTFTDNVQVSLVLTPLISLAFTDQDTTWADSFQYAGFANYQENFAEQLVLTDSLGLGYGLGTNDQTSLVDSMGLGYGDSISDTMVFSDSELNVFGIPKAFTDQFVMSDSLLAGYGMVSSDQIILVDSLGAGYGGQLSDQDTTWADSVAFLTVVSEVLSDQMTQTDSLGVGYGNSLTDLFPLFFDSFVITVGIPSAFSDQLTLSDSEAATLGMLENVFDQLVMTESWGLGYGDAIQDQLVLSDSIVGGYGAATSDQLVIVDNLGLGYGGLFSDQDTTWADAIALLGGITEAFSEQFVMSDRLGAGYGMATSDQVIIVDSLGAGYGASLTDQDTFWADLFQFSGFAGLQQTISDGFTLTDFMALGYGNKVSDQIVLSEQLTVGYGLVLPGDTANNWADNVVKLIGLVEVVTDGFTLSDKMTAGYGVLFSEQTVIVDSMSMGYGGLLSDTVNNWADTVTLFGPASKTFADSINFLTDANAIGYGDTFSDTFTLSDQMTAGYGAVTSDQLVIVDSMSMGYGGLLSDTINNWVDQVTLSEVLSELASDSFTITDSMTKTLDYLKSFSEQNVLADSTTLGQGLGTSDQMTVTDVLALGYGMLFAENVDFLADFAQIGTAATNLFLTLSDTTAFWADLLQFGIGFAESLPDQLLMADSIQAGYGMFVSDQDVTLTESVQQSMSTEMVVAETLSLSDSLGIGHGFQLSDTTSLSDSVGVGYGFLLEDSTNFWAESVQEASFIGLTLFITDDISQYWMDNLQLFMVGTKGPLFVYQVGTLPSLLVKQIETALAMNMSAITINLGVVYQTMNTATVLNVSEIDVEQVMPFTRLEVI